MSITAIGFIDIISLDIPGESNIDNAPIYSSNPILMNKTMNKTMNKFDVAGVKCKVALISELKNKLTELNLAKVKKDWFYSRYTVIIMTQEFKPKVLDGNWDFDIDESPTSNMSKLTGGDRDDIDDILVKPEFTGVIEMIEMIY